MNEIRQDLDGAMKDRQNQIIYSTSPRSGFIIVETFSTTYQFIIFGQF